MDSVAPTFNTPLETGLRTLFILAACRSRRSFDLQRLMYLDYAVVHTADFDGPQSLHPQSPSRISQLLVRRSLIQDGLELMRSRDLVERRFLSVGIHFRATEAGRLVVDQFSSHYAAHLRERATWAVATFESMSERELIETFRQRVRPLADELIAPHEAPSVEATS